MIKMMSHRDSRVFNFREVSYGSSLDLSSRHLRNMTTSLLYHADSYESTQLSFFLKIF